MVYSDVIIVSTLLSQKMAMSLFHLLINFFGGRGGGGWSEVYCLASFSDTLEIKKTLFS